MTAPRKLGRTQLAVLEALVGHRRWSDRRPCWVWGTPLVTLRHLRRLADLGLVKTTPDRRGPAVAGKRVWYVPTAAGRPAVLEARSDRRER